jgi:CheY-like chemotaxis protein
MGAASSAARSGKCFVLSRRAEPDSPLELIPDKATPFLARQAREGTFCLGSEPDTRVGVGVRGERVSMTCLLLVEDDADVRMVMEHVLFDAGYEVEATDTSEDGRDRLQCRRYDLVLADAKLPDGTGMAVADEARENGTRALIITGYAFSLPYGVMDRYEVFLKPIRPSELLHIVEQALGGAA